MKTIKFDVFGRDVAIVKTEGGWEVFYSGADGKRRPAGDIIVPSYITESDLEQYLDDLCHEWATDQNPSIHQLD